MTSKQTQARVKLWRAQASEQARYDIEQMIVRKLGLAIGLLILLFVVAWL
jgi:hypothetical protein